MCINNVQFCLEWLLPRLFVFCCSKLVERLGQQTAKRNLRKLQTRLDLGNREATAMKSSG